MTSSTDDIKVVPITDDTAEKSHIYPTLTWSNITYDIPVKYKKKKASFWPALGRRANKTDAETAQSATDSPVEVHRRILDSVSGTVNRGEVVAILGASGAGKTTLLNIISARLGSVGTLNGDISYHGKPRDAGTWKRSVGFVEQDDIMLGLFTIQETLEYTARMRLPDSIYSAEQKRQRVQDIIDMLRLHKCKDTRIGSAAKRGISGGERKRTSIGMELVSDANLLLLDEPTSGLDAYAAFSVVENLCNTARLRRLSCLMTIHQPSWALLNLVDRVQLLAQGQIYYEGKPSDMRTWFEGINYFVPDGTNPADYYITIAENPYGEAEGKERVQRMIQAWNMRSDVSEHKQVDADLSSSSLEAYRFWPTNWFREVFILMIRNIKMVIRDRDTNWGVVGQTIVMLILIGFAFFRLGRSQNDVLARIGVLFFLVINTQFTVVLPVITPFPLQRAVMMRERSAGMYRSSSFLVAKLLVETPNNIIQRLPFFILFYWMVGLKATASAFFIFIGICSVQVIVSVCLGIFIGSVSRSMELANILAPMLSIIFLLFGGNLLPAPPPWFVWLRYISPTTYSYLAVSQNEFTGEQFTCNQGGSQCYTTGQQVLDQYHLTTFTIGQCIGFLGALAMLFAFMAYLGVRFTAHPRFRYK